MSLGREKARIALPFLHGPDAVSAHSASWTRARPWERALTVAVLAASLDALLWLYLYLRPTPFARPFALDPAHYVFHAIFYGAWAHALLALPFIGLAWLWPRRSRLLLATQVALTCLVLVIGAVDRECQRFMGMHATLSWLKTYAALHRTPQAIFDSIASDAGGAYGCLLPLPVLLAFPWAAWVLSRRVTYPALNRARAGCLVAVFCVVPSVMWTAIPGGRLRQLKVRPALLIAWHELQPRTARAPSRAEIAPLVQRYHEHQTRNDPSGAWAFSNADYPLLKHYVGRAPEPSARPNFIVLQLETFRAKDMKSVNPELAGPSPTPFLDALAADERSALFMRHLASGVPTVHAFMSIHAGLLMHPTKSIPSESTQTHIEGFPDALRRHGYHALHFTGSDPDWDSQRVWLDRWYDEVHYDPSHDERDRAVFRSASARIREVARGGAPFLAYLSSISNHHPFRLPKGEPTMTTGETAIDSLHNTMHYTDDVVRELYESLAGEPFFANTIWIITGDHGFDLADRGEAGGHENLRHETTWVPLLIHGRDPRLPRGQITAVSAHIDLAPTIAELASVWDDNSYMGHSLLHVESDAETLVLRYGNYAFETREHALFKPMGDGPLIYAGSDLVQTRPVQAPAELLARAADLAHAYEATLAYAVDNDRVLPSADRISVWAQAQ